MDIGQSFVDPGFLSTSLGPSYAFYSFSQRHDVNAISMILLSTDVQGAYISNAKDASNHTEAEFLIDRGTTYTLRQKKTIPNMNRGHPVKEILLLIWDATK